MFKDIFSNLIQKKGLSPYKVAKETSIPKSIVYEWNSGKSEPVSKYLIELADYLNVSVDYLLGRTDIESINKADTSHLQTSESTKETENENENENENELLRVYRSLPPRAKHDLMAVMYEMEDENELERDREKYIRYDVG